MDSPASVVEHSSARPNQPLRAEDRRESSRSRSRSGENLDISSSARRFFEGVRGTYETQRDPDAAGTAALKTLEFLNDLAERQAERTGEILSASPGIVIGLLKRLGITDDRESLMQPLIDETGTAQEQLLAVHGLFKDRLLEIKTGVKKEKVVKTQPVLTVEPQNVSAELKTGYHELTLEQLKKELARTERVEKDADAKMALAEESSEVYQLASRQKASQIELRKFIQDAIIQKKSQLPPVEVEAEAFPEDEDRPAPVGDSSKQEAKEEESLASTVLQSSPRATEDQASPAFQSSPASTVLQGSPRATEDQASPAPKTTNDSPAYSYLFDVPESGFVKPFEQKTTADFVEEYQSLGAVDLLLEKTRLLGKKTGLKKEEDFLKLAAIKKIIQTRLGERTKKFEKQYAEQPPESIQEATFRLEARAQNLIAELKKGLKARERAEIEADILLLQTELDVLKNISTSRKAEDLLAVKKSVAVSGAEVAEIKVSPVATEVLSSPVVETMIPGEVDNLEKVSTEELFIRLNKFGSGLVTEEGIVISNELQTRYQLLILKHQDAMRDLTSDLLQEKISVLEKQEAEYSAQNDDKQLWGVRAQLEAAQSLLEEKKVPGEKPEVGVDEKSYREQGTFDLFFVKQMLVGKKTAGAISELAVIQKILDDRWQKEAERFAENCQVASIKELRRRIVAEQSAEENWFYEEATDDNQRATVALNLFDIRGHLKILKEVLGKKLNPDLSQAVEVYKAMDDEELFFASERLRLDQSKNQANLQIIDNLIQMRWQYFVDRQVKANSDLDQEKLRAQFKTFKEEQIFARDFLKNQPVGTLRRALADLELSKVQGKIQACQDLLSKLSEEAETVAPAETKTTEVLSTSVLEKEVKTEIPTEIAASLPPKKEKKKKEPKPVSVAPPKSKEPKEKKAAPGINMEDWPLEKLTQSIKNWNQAVQDIESFLKDHASITDEFQREAMIARGDDSLKGELESTKGKLESAIAIFEANQKSV